MLAKAVHEHTPVGSGPKGSTSQRFNATATGKPKALKPRPASILNRSSPTSFSPLKRTASSQEQGLKQALMNSIQPSLGGAKLDMLHNPVYFDENDFENDEDIDLDATDSPIPATSHTLLPDLPQKPASSHTLLPDQPQKKSTPPRTSPSSTPLPWSSSPPTNNQMPQTAMTANTFKRRTLPWVEDAKKADHAQAEKRKRDTAFTPLPKGKDKTNSPFPWNKNASAIKEEPFVPVNSPFPWNKTASAVKEEQKRLRKGHKKLSIDVEAGSEASNMKKKRRAAVPKVFLSDEQMSVLKLVAEQKKSVFFTGSAGTGKSVLLREIIKALRAKYTKELDRVAVTASTGLAACNVGGVTLHSFAGIGLGKEAVPELVKKVKRNQKAKNRWLRTKVLIVDEISMVDGDLFDKLEAIARAIRNNGRPFGGIQLIITGDFFQLPPVPDSGRISKFSFDASTWNTSIEHTIGLTQVFRQKDPGTFFCTNFQEDH